MKAAPLLAFALLWLAACTEAFDPFVESDRTFALYGLFDARQDTQFVRVQPLVRDAGAEDAVARVTSTALATGAEMVWRDSLVQLDDGTEGTVFFALFRPEVGQAYRLVARRFDGTGRPSEAVVRIAEGARVEVERPEILGQSVAQKLTLLSERTPEHVGVVYTVRPPGGTEPVTFRVGYEVVEQTARYRLLVALARDAEAIREALGETGDIGLVRLELAYDLVDPAQAEVTGGIGTVGTAASFAAPWTLPEEFVLALGFQDEQDRTDP